MWELTKSKCWNYNKTLAGSICFKAFKVIKTNPKNYSLVNQKLTVTTVQLPNNPS